MSPAIDSADGPAPQAHTEGSAISPLPGEPGIPDVAERPRRAMSRKGLLAVGLLLGSLVAVAAISIQRFTASGRSADDAGTQRVGDRPTAASMAPRQLEMPNPSAPAAPPPAIPKIPALLPATDETAEPIGVRRTGPGAPSTLGTKTAAPEDAPVLLVSTRPSARAPSGIPVALASDMTTPSAETTAPPVTPDPNDPLRATTRNLQGYQRQLQGLLDTLTKSAALATGQPGAAPVPLPLGTPLSGLPPLGGLPMPGSGLFGGQLQGSATPRVAASVLGNRSLTLPKGTAFTCALKTRVISAASGLVGCQVLRNVYSDDGRVLLIERGSHLDGEYRITSVRPGTVRIPVLWTRIRTPLGVTVDIDSPGTGPLGESGIDGFVDNRWGERIGAAMLLSLIDDSVKLIIQNQTSDTQADTIVLPSTTSNTSKLAEKVLDSTINIPPLIYQNQGGIVGIYVARDVDFSTVYELQPVTR
jgi:type IV secretion system protein VirB10